MKIIEAMVTDFYLPQEHPRIKVKVMAELKLEGVLSRQLVWVELTSEEIETALHLARQVEQRLLADNPEIPELERRMGARSDRLS